MNSVVSIDAIRPLVEAGFAVHWLHPRTKRPIGDEWQHAQVASLAWLRAKHRHDNNVGVRLGQHSLLTSGGYLHAFDIDIRVADLADEAWESFDRLLPGVRDTLPSVASGSGSTSEHLYFVTDAPFFGKKLAVSEGKHRGADGKWHYDWEIELFGTGKQIVLPPSIHPDTGLPYRWKREFDFEGMDFGLQPHIPVDQIEALGVAETAEYEFEKREPLEFKPGQLEAELDLVPIDRLDDYHDWITLGQALHHQFGGSTGGYDLWIAHSKRSAKFEGTNQRELLRKWRGFGRNRRKPVTMASVRLWVQEARSAALLAQFDEVEDEEDDAFGNSGDALADDFETLLGGNEPEKTDSQRDPFDDDVAAALATSPLDWVSLLDLNEEGAIKPTLHNLRLIVENDVWTKGVVAFNQFTQEIVQRGQPGTKNPRRANSAKKPLQLDGESWVLRDRVNGDFWTEDKDNAIRALIEAPKSQGGYGIKVPDRDLRAAIDIAGRKNGFHPVCEYLEGLTWDGVPRVRTLFQTYMGAPDDAYHRQVSEIMLVAAVARVHEPGAKFDTAVILEGVQGKRKSTFISILAKNWFVELDCDVTDTQAVVELLQGAWLVELNELGGFTKADVRHVKAFISRRSDKVRLAYAKRAQEYHRQSILVGSTNDDVYLRDSTGGRRFLPVRCSIEGEIDTDRLLAEVDQLWAEALLIYRKMRENQPRGTLPLYLSDAEARDIAERLQESRQVESSEDAIAGQIAEWLERPVYTGSIDDPMDGKVRNETCLLEIWCDCLDRDAAQYTGMWPAALGRAMRMVPGWRESARRPRFGKYGQQRAFERVGWVRDHLRL